MDLLLQIDDVLVCVVDVWILAQGTRLRCALFLASEVHLGHRVVVRTIAVGSAAAKYCAFTEATTCFRMEKKVVRNMKNYYLS